MTHSGPAAKSADPSPAERSVGRLLDGACVLSGATVLISALAWPRLLGPVSVSGAPQACALAAGLLALGFGAWISVRIAERFTGITLPFSDDPATVGANQPQQPPGAIPGLTLAAMQGAIGLYGLLAIGIFPYGAALYRVVETGADDPAVASLLPLARVLVGLVLAGVPAALMGASILLTAHLFAAADEPRGLGVLRALSLSALGGAAGAAATSYIFLALFGVRGTCILSTLASFAAAALVVAYVRGAPSAQVARERTRAGAQPPSTARAARGHTSAGGRLQTPTAITGVARSGAGTSMPDPESKGFSESLGRTQAAGAPNDDAHPASRDSRSATLAATAVVSCALMILATVWARRLGLFFGSEIRVLALTPIGVLAGLGLGSALGARLLGRGHDPARLLRWGLLLAAAGPATTIPLMDRLAPAQIELMLTLGFSYGTYLLAAALVATALAGPAAMGVGLAVSGAIWGMASARAKADPGPSTALATGSRSVATSDVAVCPGFGASAGSICALGAVGAAAGAMASAQILIPFAGSQRTAEIAVLLLAGAVGLTWTRAAGAVSLPRGTAMALRLAIPAAFSMAVFLPRWDARAAHAGYSKFPITFLQRYQQVGTQPRLEPRTIRFLAEGKDAAISVGTSSEGRNTLFIDARSEGSDAPEERVTGRLLALLPGLFHEAPKRALVIGLGPGVPVATLARLGVESIDVVAASSAEAKAARAEFGTINERVMDDPRVTIRRDDGGGLLRARLAASYDLILGGRSQPWVLDESALFTDEFFAEAGTKLRPDGIFCQLLPFDTLSYDRIQLLVRTFARSFDEAALFATRGGDPTGDLLLIGSNSPLRLAHLPEDRALPEAVRAAFVEIKNPGTQQLLSGLIAGPRDIASFAGTGPINTRNRPILELATSGDRFSPHFSDNLGRLLSAMGRTSLPTGPKQAPALAAPEFARDGFALVRGIPEGRETLRGITVLTRVRPGGEAVSRWVLFGREFEAGDTSTGLYRLARAPQGPAEVLDIATSLAGLASMRTQGATLVNGHPAVWTASETISTRTVALGWICPERGQAFFLSARVPLANAPSGQDLAADLAVRFPCAH